MVISLSHAESKLTHRIKQICAGCILHRRQRQTQIILAIAHCRHCRLDGDGVDLREERVDQAVIPTLKLCRARDVAAEEAAAQTAADEPAEDAESAPEPANKDDNDDYKPLFGGN